MIKILEIQVYKIIYIQFFQMIIDNFFVSQNYMSEKLGSKQNLYKILDIDHKASFNQNKIVEIFLPPYEKLSISF